MILGGEKNLYRNQIWGELLISFVQFAHNRTHAVQVHLRGLSTEDLSLNAVYYINCVKRKSHFRDIKDLKF